MGRHETWIPTGAASSEIKISENSGCHGSIRLQRFGTRMHYSVVVCVFQLRPPTRYANFCMVAIDRRLQVECNRCSTTLTAHPYVLQSLLHLHKLAFGYETSEIFGILIHMFRICCST